MNLHDLSPAPGSRRKPKRLGLGMGSGTGKTSGKGHKGQKSRAGGGVKIHFEGGQMPLVRRTPKRGFSNYRHALSYETVNVGDIEACFDAGATITAEELIARRLVANPGKPIKILGDGELVKSFTIKANAFSASAKTKIEAVGGKAEVV